MDDDIEYLPAEITTGTTSLAFAQNAGSQQAAKNPVMVFLARVSKSSRVTMTSVLQVAADRFGYEDVPIHEVPWHQLEPGHLAALMAAMAEDNYAPSTTALCIATIRGVMNEAWLLGLIDHEQLARIRTVKPNRGSRLAKGKNLKRSLIRELMDACANDERPQGVRDAAIIALLYGTGMRKAESVSFQCQHINFAERTIKVIGKGNKEMLKYAPGWVFDKIRAWLDYRGAVTPHAEYLFNRIRKGGVILDVGLTKHAITYIVQQRALEVGVSMTPHDFRRSFITRVIDEHDVSIAQALAGHASPTTTMRYDMRGEEKKRQVADRFDL